MPKYLDEPGLTRFYDNIADRPVYTFDTVAKMQAATYLEAGMTCHTNGFHASGDGGAAYYTVGTTGDIALHGGLYATRTVYDQRVAIIGDSYTNGNYYLSILRDILPNASIDKYCAGGAGFVREAGGYGTGNNFSKFADDLIASGKTYDVVIVYGGINDFHYGNTAYSANDRWGYIPYANVGTAIANVTNKLDNYAGTANARRIALLNATIYTNINDYANVTSDTTQTWALFYKQYIDYLRYNRWDVIADSFTWLWSNHSNIYLTAVPANELYDTDNTHPSAKGSQVIANHIANILCGGYTQNSMYAYRYRANQNIGTVTRPITFMQGFTGTRFFLLLSIQVNASTTIDYAVPTEYIFLPMLQKAALRSNGVSISSTWGVAVSPAGALTGMYPLYIDSDGKFHIKDVYTHSGSTPMLLEYYLEMEI